MYQQQKWVAKRRRVLKAKNISDKWFQTTIRTNKKVSLISVSMNY